MNGSAEEIIEMLAVQEEAVGSLYATFSEMLPEQADFWNKLVGEEKAHAEVIRALDAMIRESGESHKKQNKFNTTAIRTNIEHIQKQEKRARENGITPLRALALATDIEHSLVESGFFQIIISDSARVQNELKAIEEHTRKHIARVEKSLNDLKTGNAGQETVKTSLKNNAVMPEDKRKPPKELQMDTKNKITEAQRVIINKLALCEEAISALYATYAKSLPELSDFWTELSKAETTHATLLKSMNKQLEKGNIFYNLGRFDMASIEEFLKKVTSARTDAEKHKIHTLDAINTALSIETSVLDAHFYDIVKSDAPEYNIIAQRLASDTDAHAKKVQEKLRSLKTGKA